MSEYQYKLYADNPLTGEKTNYVRRLNDGAVIPFNESNIDYLNYLKWLDEGNEPEPADPIPTNE